ncbi:N-6 DNA methylase [Rhodococcus fascians]|nr:N-6 DNA methylase [Rhodococcus fascians]MBY4238344.1 N-6 DNA methylase [Rhodococcus fascians]MBY4254275.1 N-6 DNA methylase [Rhodococcus fascians]MBY4269656.1 N-6 DNA methylase [Rhodococcus fascians]
MSLSNAQLAAIVGRIAVRDAHRSEATLQADIRSLLIDADLGLAADEVVDLEVQLDDGTRRRIDIEVGSAVIEVKRDLRRANVLDDAVQQLTAYVRQQSNRFGRRYVGILTDGRDWQLYNLDPDNNGLVLIDTLQVSIGTEAETLRLWLENVLATEQHIQPTPEEIERRLGVESPAFLLDHEELTQIYVKSSKDPEVSLKRHLWARLLRTALGTSFNDDASLFVDHTLLVLEASIIAHAVIGLDLATAENKPEQLVNGSEFTAAQINNVVEAGLFDWVLKAPEGKSFVANLTRQLRRFDWSNVQHDVLKVLYESVINADTRKSLGEYYTPDWLAQKLVEQVITNPLEDRVMDPACGSGTFIFHAVRRHLAAADSSGLSNTDALASVERHVFGMDIHPVSVVLARVTYLLAIGPDRLAHQTGRGAVTVPVYLGDSMQWSNSARTVTSTTMQIDVDTHDLAGDESQGELFNIGRVLIFPLRTVDDPATFDSLVSDLATVAQTYTSSSSSRPTIGPILNRRGITDPIDRETLLSTFETLCTLNAEGRDHVWGYFVRNQVRPLWFALEASRVDVLIGNPPWVAYRFMTPRMKQQFKSFSEARNLWAAGRKVITHQDLVGLFIARSVEQYLRLNGRFAFVTPKAVLSRMQYEGLRTGRWLTVEGTKAHDTLAVRASFDVPLDLEQVRPHMFPVPSAVISGTRTTDAHPLGSGCIVVSGRLPSKWSTWETAKPLLIERAGNNRAMTTQSSYRSPYGATAYQGASIFPRVLTFVRERPKSPLGTAAGVTLVQSERSPYEDKLWKLVPDMSGSVESTFVRPVLKGESIAHYRVIAQSLAVLPVVGDRLIAESDIAQYPHLFEWWTSVNKVWDQAKTVGNRLYDALNFQGKLAGQLGKGRHRVVYTKSGTRLAATYLDDPNIVIDSSLYWLVVPDRETARYLVGILNSQPVLDQVSLLQSRGQIGRRHFDTYPFYLNIPLYDPSKSTHKALVGLSERAETVAANLDISGTGDFKRVRAQIRDALEAQGIAIQINALALEILGPVEE